MFGLSIQELMVVGIVAVLLFGKRLPEVARSLGQSYNQFRRGLQDIQTEIHRATDTRPKGSDSYSSRDTYYNDEDYTQPTAPRFELPAPANDGAASEAAANGNGTTEEGGPLSGADSADHAAGPDEANLSANS